MPDPPRPHTPLVEPDATYTDITREYDNFHTSRTLLQISVSLHTKGNRFGFRAGYLLNATLTGPREFHVTDLWVHERMTLTLLC
jgi:hypothetical protein